MNRIVLYKPIITEKSMKLTEQGLYTFLVERDATKLQVSKAVKNKFNVSVLSVKTINIKGEIKSQRRVRKFYQTPGFKKAIVLVKKGQSIPVFEKPKEEEAVITSTESKPEVLKERKDIFRRTKVKIEKASHQTMQGGAPTTQRKVIPT